MKTLVDMMNDLSMEVTAKDENIKINQIGCNALKEVRNGVINKVFGYLNL